ncbi:MAG: DUF3656 domain-containing protein [Bacillota bacterium]|nr:DUF3656 domain-containing protein [Bacillota bacterium]
MLHQTELLLPAGKFESLKAAVANGADAVYLAGNRYGARASAGNFNDEEMKQAVKLCHSRKVRLYVTMNTLVGDDEFSQALDYVKFLYDLGVDALIVQDLGLAGAVKSLLPAFTLHGSTQMTIHNVDTARWAYDFGFRRVILARETTLSEMKAIREAVPDLELEVFCHGAICISYSGQCLMSSLIGGRSGNRGQCAQPCRMTYELCDPFTGSLTGKPSHLLSPRDMNTLEHLKDLMELGIHGFKIEGRMRRPEYVASVGRVYRHAINAILAGKSGISSEDANLVEQVFNRDFTPGYLYGNPGLHLMSHQKPNNRGVLVGRVKKVNGKIITLELERELHLGDGIEIWVKVGGRTGSTVSDLRVNKQKTTVAYPGEEAEIHMAGRISKGDRVFKTYDAQLMTDAVASYENLSLDLPVDFTVKAHLGQLLTISAIDCRGAKAEVVSSYIVEAAQKTATDEAMVKKQLSRLGGSGYSLRKLHAILDDGIILPASILNQVRRELVEKLDRQVQGGSPVVKNYPYQEAKKKYLALTKEKPKRNVPKIAVKVRDVYQVKAAMDSGAELIYFAPHFGFEAMTEEQWQQLAVINEAHPNFLVYALPAVRQDDKQAWLERDIEAAVSHGFQSFLCGQAGDLRLKERYPQIQRFYGDYSQNVFNNYTARELFDMGFERVTCSLELKKEDLDALARTAGSKEVVVHGRMPMMLSRHCVIGASLGKDKTKVPCGYYCYGNTLYLKDRMGMTFPVVGDRYHNMNLYNCKELCLIDELDHLSHFQVWRIEGQFADIGSLKEIIKLYRTAREQALAKGEGEYQKEFLSSSVQIYSNAGFTKGHFYRGVKS